MDSKPIKVSALAMAKRTDDIMIRFTAEDVRRFRPGWSGPEAQFFLDERRDEIGHAMVEVGLLALRALIESYEAERRSRSN